MREDTILAELRSNSAEGLRHRMGLGCSHGPVQANGSWLEKGSSMGCETWCSLTIELEKGRQQKVRSV
jgi:hypothetical protein